MATPVTSDYIVYEIAECKLYVGGKEHTILSEEVESMSYYRDYTGESVFPLLSMTVLLDRYSFFDLMKNKESAVMNLKLNYYELDPDNNTKKSGKKTYTWFNEKFVIKTDEKHFDLMPITKNEEDKLERSYEDKEKGVYANKNYPIELFLYVEKDLNAAYTVTNRVYSNADLNTIVAHQLTCAGMEKVVMSPLVNKTVTEAISMPYTLIYNLRYLEAMYGLHSHGTLLFFDIDYKYILNRVNALTVWTKDDPGAEYTKIMMVIRKDDDMDMFMGGSERHDDKKVYINVDPANITFSSMGDVDNYIYGGESISVDSKTFKRNSSKISSPDIKKVHKKFLHSKYNNPLSHASRAQGLNDNNLIAIVTVIDSNLIWFRPYRKFTFLFENPELQKILGGDSKIVSCNVTFIKEQGTFFRTRSELVFALKE